MESTHTYAYALACVVAILLTAQDCEESVTVEDHDFEIAEDGTELRPGALPFFVASELEDDTILPEAIEWWNDQVGCEIFLEAGEYDMSEIMVSEGLAPGDETLGITYIDYAPDGTILSAEVVLSSDFSYDRPTALKALDHELGHGGLGLADDPGPPTTVDLMSIMSDPLDPLGELTDHDFDLVEEYLP